MIALVAAGMVVLMFALISIAPEVGATNGACERYPCTSGCR